jgi:transcriptional regulator with XRE-family HTH domain
MSGRVVPAEGSKPELIALGRVIRRERHAKGLTIEALAHKAGMSPWRLGRIERGEIKRRNLRVGQVYVVAEALGVPFLQLVIAAEGEARRDGRA